MSERFLNVTLPILIVSCIVIAVVSALLPITPPWPGNRRQAEHVLRQANLRVVARSVIAFPDETEDGSFSPPEQYGEILLRQFEVMPEPLFGDDDTQDLIWIVPFPWPDRRIPDDITPEQLAQTPLLHERVDLNPDGTSVAFWDGHVELLTNEEFEAIIDVEQSVCLACAFALPSMMEQREP